MSALVAIRKPYPQRLGAIMMLWTVAGLLNCLPESAEAQTGRRCNVLPQPGTLLFNQLNISRDTAVGAPISEELTVNTLVTCPDSIGQGGNGIGFRMQVVPVRRVSGTVRDVWETGVPGIGVRVYSRELARVVSNTTSAHVGTVWGRWGNAVNYILTHQLVKTGPIDTTGQLQFGKLYSFWHSNAAGSRRDVATGPLAYVSIANATLAARSCRVTTPDVRVTLPDTLASTLGNNGASIGNTGFFIGLQCDANTNVHITLTDATTPGNRTNLLSLTADSTARGVAIRVRRPDNAPVSFGPDSPAAGNANQWRVGQRSGAVTVPMSAEYVATGNVTAGTVRALATFTMSYH